MVSDTWNEKYFFSMRRKGVLFQDEKELLSFFGSPLPEKFARQSLVDEVQNIDVSTGLKLLAESNNDERSFGVMELFRQLYGCLYLDPGDLNKAGDMFKCLLRLVGFNSIPDIFMYGPLKMKLPFPVGKGKGSWERGDESLETSSAHVGVLSVHSEVLLVVHEFSEYDSDDLDEAMAADLVAAYYRTLGTLNKSGDIYGIAAVGSMCTFYHMRLEYEGFSKLLERVQDLEEEWSELGKEGEGEAEAEGEEEEDENILVVRKCKISDCHSASFITLSTDNMYITLQCLEALKGLVLASQRLLHPNDAFCCE